MTLLSFCLTFFLTPEVTKMTYFLKNMTFIKEHGLSYEVVQPLILIRKRMLSG